jgi:hypothetical protein
MATSTAAHDEFLFFAAGVFRSDTNHLNGGMN